MNRPRTPTEFGFTTGPYLPPEPSRPIWRTILFGTLLLFIPLVGPAVSAIYIDRRQIPGSFDFIEALKTAFVQILALAVIALIVAFILTSVGLSRHLIPQFNGVAR